MGDDFVACWHRVQFFLREDMVSQGFAMMGQGCCLVFSFSLLILSYAHALSRSIFEVEEKGQVKEEVVGVSKGTEAQGKRQSEQWSKPVVNHRRTGDRSSAPLARLWGEEDARVIRAKGDRMMALHK